MDKKMSREQAEKLADELRAQQPQLRYSRLVKAFSQTSAANTYRATVLADVGEDHPLVLTRPRAVGRCAIGRMPIGDAPLPV